MKQNTPLYIDAAVLAILLAIILIFTTTTQPDNIEMWTMITLGNFAALTGLLMTSALMD